MLTRCHPFVIASAMLRAARFVFWSALAVSFVMAILPHPPVLPGSPTDKVQHILAFATLGALGSIAFPQVPLMRLALWLIAFGALIEAVQAIPALNRSSDLADLLADALAVVVAAPAARWLIRRLER